MVGMSALLSLPHKASPRPETMDREEYGRLLNVLLEAERAGAKLLAAYADELPPDSDAWAWLRVIQRDEARNCSVLIHLLLEEGFEPSTAIGDFYRHGLAIRGWGERLWFLNRGQRWVARTIAGALPCLSNFVGKKPLQAMYDSHLVNIGICEQHLKL
jgi:hypothetical protein